MKRRDPKTPEEWQIAVDAALGLRAIADCQMYGLLTGGGIDIHRCDEILERGRRREIHPSRPVTELAIEMVMVINSEENKA